MPRIPPPPFFFLFSKTRRNLAQSISIEGSCGSKRWPVFIDASHAATYLRISTGRSRLEKDRGSPGTLPFATSAFRFPLLLHNTLSLPFYLLFVLYITERRGRGCHLNFLDVSLMLCTNSLSRSVSSSRTHGVKLPLFVSCVPREALLCSSRAER